MSVNTVDLKDQIEQLCSERGIEYGEVIKAIEQAVASAYRKQYGDKDKFYDATFDPATAKYSVFEVVKIVEEVINPIQQISLMEARLANPMAQMGESIITHLDADQEMDFGRIAAQIAKQVLFQAINGARHTKLLAEFKDKIGQIVSVEIDYYNKGGYVVKLGQASGFLAKENLLPIDKFKSGQMVKALIVDINEDARGNSRLFLSRSSTQFIEALIASEIPEVENGIVRIEKIVREAGSRSKVLVSTADGENVDPVGTILGKKNMRITNILRQISISMQEKIDIIELTDDLELMVMDCLEPAEIDRVEINSEQTKAKVYCHKDTAPLAVGKRGVNIRLAGELLDLEIELITDEPRNKFPNIIME